MTKADLIALAERVERAEGPDRELDFAIADGILGKLKAPYRRGHCLTYTASLDAAMTLAGDREWSVSHFGPGHHAGAEVWLSGGDETECSTAVNPASALTSASLRAIAEEMD